MPNAPQSNSKASPRAIFNPTKHIKVLSQQNAECTQVLGSVMSLAMLLLAQQYSAVKTKADVSGCFPFGDYNSLTRFHHFKATLAVHCLRLLRRTTANHLHLHPLHTSPFSNRKRTRFLAFLGGIGLL